MDTIECTHNMVWFSLNFRKKEEGGKVKQIKTALPELDDSNSAAVNSAILVH